MPVINQAKNRAGLHAGRVKGKLWRQNHFAGFAPIRGLLDPSLAKTGGVARTARPRALAVVRFSQCAGFAPSRSIDPR
jgi:hypothetical protein